MSAEIESSTKIVFLSGPDTSDRLGRYDPEGPQTPPISVLLLSGMRADGKSAPLGRRTRYSCAVCSIIAAPPRVWCRSRIQCQYKSWQRRDMRVLCGVRSCVIEPSTESLAPRLRLRRSFVC